MSFVTMMLAFALDLQVQPREPQSSTLCGRCGPVGFSIRACEANELFPEKKDTVFMNEGELVGLYRTAVGKRELSIRAFTCCASIEILQLLKGLGPSDWLAPLSQTPAYEVPLSKAGCWGASVEQKQRFRVK
ncbi:hypothetical protein EYF80_030413 [Liparis tanakae]|uniref:Uncharacterized protein n=1 Tax=Liparis tanakae TaxID=230148 RepID=A0A4Z2H0N3_9TELE|nr:hypothetical protein EYF80_030413 [Liparis tanakae]